MMKEPFFKHKSAQKDSFLAALELPGQNWSKRPFGNILKNTKTGSGVWRHLFKF